MTGTANRATEGADESTSPGGGDGRDETPNERYDRNWVDILQELRVTQTGTQIISGFLLTLAFQQRFRELDTYQTVVYILLVFLAASSTGLSLAPVSLHRDLFRRREKGRMVAIANRLLQATLAVVTILTTGVVLFILDVVVSRTAGIAAGIGTLLFMVTLLLIVPRLARSAQDRNPRSHT